MEEDIEEEDDEESTEPEAVQPKSKRTTVNKLTDDLSTMAIVSKPTSAAFGMGFTFPYILYTYIEDGKRRVSVDFLVIGMAKENFRLRVVQGGKALQLVVVIPSFFADENRLQLANEEDQGFNKRSHKATALEEVVHKITENIDGEEPLLGSPQQVSLPVPCEEEIHDWETLAFNNEDMEWSDLFQNQQHFFVLSVDLISTIKISKKKKTGGFRSLGRPSRVVNKEEDEDEDEDGDGMEEDGGGTS